MISREIVVVGDNPAALLLAYELRQKGIGVRRLADPSPPRAYLLHQSTADALAAVEVGGLPLPSASPYEAGWLSLSRGLLESALPLPPPEPLQDFEVGPEGVRVGYAVYRFVVVCQESPAEPACVYGEIEAPPILRLEPGLAMWPLASGRCAVIAEMGIAETLEVARWQRREIVPSAPYARPVRQGPLLKLGSGPAWDVRAFNRSLLDAHNLAWKMSVVMDGRAVPELLDSYGGERGYAHQASLDGLSYRGHSHVLGEWAAQPREWPDVRGRHRAQNYWRSFPQGPAAGDLAPDVSLFDPERGRRQRLQEILGENGDDHHLLVLVGGHLSRTARNSVKKLARALRDRLRGLGHVHLVSHERLVVAAGVRLWLDDEGQMHSRYGAKEDSFYWIRPDGFVGYRSQPAQIEPFLRYLERHYGQPRDRRRSAE